MMARQQTLAASIDWSHDRLDDGNRSSSGDSGCSPVCFRWKPPKRSSPHRGRVAQKRSSISSAALSTRASSWSAKAPAASPATGCWRPCAPTRSIAPHRGELSALARCARALVDGLARTELRDAHRRRSRSGRSSSTTTSRPRSTGRSTIQLSACVSSRPGAVWAQLGCEGDAIPAADQLLNATNAEQHTSAWLAAAEPATELYVDMRGPNEWHAL